MAKEEHIHDFKPRALTVPLHSYVFENGKIVKDLIKGRDKLKQWVCKCGTTETYDLERNTNG